jgi:hypothetical protein
VIPTLPTIQELRVEFEQRDVRGWIWPWLARVLEGYVRARIKGRYKEALYSPTGVWDGAGVRDLVTDFLLKRGVAGGAVLRALAVAPDTPSLIRYLERALHHYTISARVRTIEGNIFSRLSDVLAKDSELQCFGGGTAGPMYGDAAWAAAPPPALHQVDLRAAVSHVPPDVHWQGGDARRNPPGLSSEALGRLARAVIRGTGRLMTAVQLMHVIQQRFDLRSEAALTTDLDAARTAAVALPAPLDELVAEDLARKALNSMTDRQRAVLRHWFSEPSSTVRDIAESMGISKSLVNTEQRAIAETFQRLRVAAGEEQRQVLAAAARIV